MNLHFLFTSLRWPTELIFSVQSLVVLREAAVVFIICKADLHSALSRVISEQHRIIQ